MGVASSPLTHLSLTSLPNMRRILPRAAFTLRNLRQAPAPSAADAVYLSVIMGWARQAGEGRCPRIL